MSSVADANSVITVAPELRCEAINFECTVIALRFIHRTHDITTFFDVYGNHSHPYYFPRGTWVSPFSNLALLCAMIITIITALSFAPSVASREPKMESTCSVAPGVCGLYTCCSCCTNGHELEEPVFGQTPEDLATAWYRNAQPAFGQSSKDVDHDSTGMDRFWNSQPAFERASIEYEVQSTTNNGMGNSSWWTWWTGVMSRITKGVMSITRRLCDVESASSSGTIIPLVLQRGNTRRTVQISPNDSVESLECVARLKFNITRKDCIWLMHDLSTLRTTRPNGQPRLLLDYGVNKNSAKVTIVIMGGYGEVLPGGGGGGMVEEERDRTDDMILEEASDRTNDKVHCIVIATSLVPIPFASNLSSLLLASQGTRRRRQ